MGETKDTTGLEKIKSIAAIIIALLSAISVLVLYIIINSAVHDVNTKLEEKERALDVKVSNIVAENEKDKLIEAKKDSIVNKSIDSLHHIYRDLQYKINKGKGAIDVLYDKDKGTNLNLPKPD